MRHFRSPNQGTTIMSSRTAVKLLLALVLGLPILQATFAWVGGLLGAMGDAVTANVLSYINTATGVTWLISVVALVVALAVRTLDDTKKG
jgi:putative copper export protein